MVSQAQPFSTIADDDDKKKAQEQASSAAPVSPTPAAGVNVSSTPTTGGGQSGSVITGSSPSNPSSGSQPAPSVAQPGNTVGTSSGSYTNLQKYFNANQGAANGGMANQVAGTISNAATQAKTNVGAAAQTFQNAANTQVQNAQTNAAVFNPAGPNAAFDPTAIVNNADSLAKAQAARDASYAGPKSLSDLDGNLNYSKLQLDTQNANNLAKSAGTETGRYGLLKQMYGSPSYSRGQQDLDNFFVQNSPNQQKAFQPARQDALAAKAQLGSAQVTSQQEAADAAAKVQAVSDNTRKQLNDAVTGLDTSIQGRVAQGAAAQATAAANAYKLLASGNAPASLDGLRAGQNIWDLDLTKYLGQGPQATAAAMATKDDYAKMAALQQLTGSTTTDDAAKAFATYGDPNKSKNFNPNALAFDYGKFNTDAQTKSSEYAAKAKAINDTLAAYIAKGLGPNYNPIAQYQADTDLAKLKNQYKFGRTIGGSYADNDLPRQSDYVVNSTNPSATLPAADLIAGQPVATATSAAQGTPVTRELQGYSGEPVRIMPPVPKAPAAPINISEALGGNFSGLNSSDAAAIAMSIAQAGIRVDPALLNSAVKPFVENGAAAAPTPVPVLSTNLANGFFAPPAAPAPTAAVAKPPVTAPVLNTAVASRTPAIRKMLGAR